MNSDSVSWVPDNSAGIVLTTGHLATGHQAFCSLYKLLTCTYLKAIRKSLPEALRSDLIDSDIFWNRQWHFYYVWPFSGSAPIWLVPEDHFRSFLRDISFYFPDVNLSSWSAFARYRDFELLIDFPEHPRFTPRYLGETRSRKQFLELRQQVPSKDFRPIDEAAEPPIEQHDMDTFTNITRGQAKLQQEMTGEETMKMILQLQSQQKADIIAQKKQQRKDKQAKRRVVGAEMFRRSQQYFGMRPLQTEGQVTLSRLDPSKPIPHHITDPVILVCFDVESWERDHSVITEIGLAIFNTSALATNDGAIAGAAAKNWQSLIQAHHYRIIENSNFSNRDFVQSNPYGFSFGISEDISISSASLILEDLFDSLSSPNTTAAAAGVAPETQASSSGPPKIVLVGHAVTGDIQYMERLGFNIAAHSAVIDTVDTQVLWNVLNNHSVESHNAGLSKVLTALELEYGGLHNAGNDAVYTMRALLAMMVLEGTLRVERA